MDFRHYLDYAQRFIDDAESAGEQAKQRFASASLVFSGVAMETFVNDMMADFASLPDDLFTVHEMGFLQEKGVEFQSSGADIGRFKLTGRTEYRGLDQKIMFLVARFGEGTSIDKGSPWWQKFETTKDLRNKLVHTRSDQPANVGIPDARDAIQVAREIIQVVSKEVWGKEVQL